jgi:hypothetical protein
MARSNLHRFDLDHFIITVIDEFSYGKKKFITKRNDPFAMCFNNIFNTMYEIYECLFYALAIIYYV